MNIKYLAVTALALGAAVFAANSNAADTAQASSNATVITPITIASSSDLMFGSFAPATAAGTITVGTDGNRTAINAVESTIGGTPTAAHFDVTGQAEATYSIAITNSELSDGGINTMALTTFNDLSGAGATSGKVETGTLTLSGTQTIFVGGTLTVGADQVGGAYAGTIDVTVEYN